MVKNYMMDPNDDDKEHDNTSVIDLTGDDDGSDDENLRLAIALSLQEQQHQHDSSVTSKHESTSSPVLPSNSRNMEDETREPIVARNASGILGLDRKQMEMERLARLKRKRDSTTSSRTISPPPLKRDMPSTIAPTPRTISASQHDLKATTEPSSTMTSGSSKMLANTVARNLRQEFPDGRVLFTSLDDSQNQSISLKKLLQSTENEEFLKCAFLSTYIVDFDWLFPHFDTRNVSFVLGLHARDEQERVSIRQDFTGIANVRVCFPRVSGLVNCMHSKLMLLFYESTSEHRNPTRCRIVVPSANLVPWDWGIGAVMENVLFVIDLPSHSADTLINSQESTNFQTELIDVLNAMNIPQDVIKKLDQFDFARTGQYGFVHTMGGSHLLSQSTAQSSIRSFLPSTSKSKPAPDPTSGPSLPCRTGFVQLSDTVHSFGLRVSGSDDEYPLRLDFVTSSLGSLKELFLQNLYLASCGEAPAEPLRSTKTIRETRILRKEKDAICQRPNMSHIKKNMVVYFPSSETVIKSTGGPRSAGTICFQSRWWNNPETEFPKDILTDCVGIRQRTLMHSKILFARFRKPKSICTAEPLGHPERHKHDDDLLCQVTSQSGSICRAARKVLAGWAYIGSANLSESAWGSLVNDTKSKQPKLNCRNWESGVFIPVPLRPEHQGKNLHELTLQEVFGHIVPVPMEYPGVNMIQSGREPWFFNG